MKKGNGSTSHLQDHAPSFLGYCPQEDPLWPNLTVHQHLQVYAAVKGVSKEDTAAAVNRYGWRVPQGLANGLSPLLGYEEGTRKSKFTLSHKEAQETELQN